MYRYMYICYIPMIFPLTLCWILSPQNSPRTKTALPGAACRCSSPRRAQQFWDVSSCLLWSYPLVN